MNGPEFLVFFLAFGIFILGILQFSITYYLNNLYPANNFSEANYGDLSNYEIAYLIGGCGRTDFQSGNAGLMYDSVVNKLFNLPEDTLVYPGHDYKGYTVSTIGEEKRLNLRFLNKTRDEFIEIMNNLKLPNPKKIIEAVPANELCGNLKG